MLDLTGRLASRESELTFEKNVLFSMIPGHPAYNWDSDAFAKYLGKFEQDGQLKFRKTGP